MTTSITALSLQPQNLNPSLIITLHHHHRAPLTLTATTLPHLWPLKTPQQSPLASHPNSLFNLTPSPYHLALLYHQQPLIKPKDPRQPSNLKKLTTIKPKEAKVLKPYVWNLKTPLKPRTPNPTKPLDTHTKTKKPTNLPFLTSKKTTIVTTSSRKENCSNKAVREKHHRKKEHKKASILGHLWIRFFRSRQFRKEGRTYQKLRPKEWQRTTFFKF